MQSVEKTFQLTRTDKDLLSKQDHDVQVSDSCIFGHEQKASCEEIVNILI